MLHQCQRPAACLHTRQGPSHLAAPAHHPAPGPHHMPPPMRPPQVVELTAAGRSFFRGVFEAFDRDEDGVLSAREQEEMFSTAPAE